MSTEDHDILVGLTAEVAGVKDDVRELKALFQEYVTHREFGPVKSIAFGLVAAVLLIVVSALVGLVIVKQLP